MDLALPAVNAPDDADLVNQAKAGDLDAFDQLVARHYPRVFRILYRILEHTEDAEDAAQDVMLLAWRHLHRFRGRSTFSTWLHAVTVHRAFSRARRAERRRTVPLDDSVLDGVPGETSAEPHRRLERREDAEIVRRAVARLPRQQRLIVTLYYYGELRCREIAGALGVEESTVRGHLRRARESLRRRLPGPEEEDG